jgi:D-alanine-D-alanine ligase
MRLSAKGEVYVLEANPNPWLSSKQEFAMAAKSSGRSYTQLIGEIVELAMGRYRPRN